MRWCAVFCGGGGDAFGALAFDVGSQPSRLRSFPFSSRSAAAAATTAAGPHFPIPQQTPAVGAADVARAEYEADGKESVDFLHALGRLPPAQSAFDGEMDLVRRNIEAEARGGKASEKADVDILPLPAPIFAQTSFDAFGEFP